VNAWWFHRARKAFGAVLRVEMEEGLNMHRFSIIRA
jgi:hypothetical protein